MINQREKIKTTHNSPDIFFLTFRYLSLKSQNAHTNTFIFIDTNFQIWIYLLVKGSTTLKPKTVF